MRNASFFWRAVRVVLTNFTTEWAARISGVAFSREKKEGDRIARFPVFFSPFGTLLQYTVTTKRGMPLKPSSSTPIPLWGEDGVISTPTTIKLKGFVFGLRPKPKPNDSQIQYRTEHADILLPGHLAKKIPRCGIVWRNRRFSAKKYKKNAGGKLFFFRQDHWDESFSAFRPLLILFLFVRQSTCCTPVSFLAVLCTFFPSKCTWETESFFSVYPFWTQLCCTVNLTWNNEESGIYDKEYKFRLTRLNVKKLRQWRKLKKNRFCHFFPPRPHSRSIPGKKKEKSVSTFSGCQRKKTLPQTLCCAKAENHATFSLSRCGKLSGPANRIKKFKDGKSPIFFPLIRLA